MDRVRSREVISLKLEEDFELQTSFPEFQYVGFSNLIAESVFSVTCHGRSKK